MRLDCNRLPAVPVASGKRSQSYSTPESRNLILMTQNPEPKIQQAKGKPSPSKLEALPPITQRPQILRTPSP